MHIFLSLQSVILFGKDVTEWNFISNPVPYFGKAWGNFLASASYLSYLLIFGIEKRLILLQRDWAADNDLAISKTLNRRSANNQALWLEMLYFGAKMQHYNAELFFLILHWCEMTALLLTTARNRVREGNLAGRGFPCDDIWNLFTRDPIPTLIYSNL